jgi:hypothetical protein
MIRQHNSLVLNRLIARNLLIGSGPPVVAAGSGGTVAGPTATCGAVVLHRAVAQPFRRLIVSAEAARAVVLVASDE